MLAFQKSYVFILTNFPFSRFCMCAFMYLLFVYSSLCPVLFCLSVAVLWTIFPCFYFHIENPPPGELWFLTWLCAGFRRRCRTATTVYGGEGLGAAVGARWRPLVAAAVAVAPPPSAQPPDCGPGRAGGRGRWRRCTRRSAVVIDELKSLKHMFSVWKCSKKGFLCLSIFL